LSFGFGGGERSISSMRRIDREFGRSLEECRRCSDTPTSLSSIGRNF
jgi:hypothetical protein